MDNIRNETVSYAVLAQSQSFTPVTTHHVAPFDGWLLARTTESPAFNELFINSISMAKVSRGSYGTAYSTMNFPFPIRKGETFRLTSTAGQASLKMFKLI